MSFKKIVNHPDKEEIIKKLLDGMSPRQISKWLVSTYPDNRDNHIHYSVIHQFRKDYLDLDKESILILRRERKKKELGLPHNPNMAAFIEKDDWPEEERDKNVRKALLASPTYQEKLKEITDAALDGPILMKQLTTLLQSRLEVYYNEIASGSHTGDTLKADRMFAEYVNLMKDLVKDAKKVEQDYNAVPDDGSVNLDIVHKMVGVVRDVVKEMLGQLDSNLALEFMDRLHTKLNSTAFDVPRAPDIIDRAERMVKQIDKIKSEQS